jgi:hypothetical protein
MELDDRIFEGRERFRIDQNEQCTVRVWSQNYSQTSFNLIRFPLVQYCSSRGNVMATRLMTVLSSGNWKQNACGNESHPKMGLKKADVRIFQIKFLESQKK